MEPGDAIVWDRWAFHRSVPFKATANATATESTATASDIDSAAAASGALKLRYSIRYIPSTAKAAGAGLYTGLHESVTVGQPFTSPHNPQVST
jgi:hypothetical protein